MNLTRLGFASYGQYLKSPLWASIRGRLMARGECWACGGKPSCVHHSSYPLAALAGNDDSVLYALCDRCHEWGHKGAGSDPMVATKKLRDVRRQRLDTGVAPRLYKLPNRLWKRLGGKRTKRQDAQALLETSRIGGELRSGWLGALERNF